MIISEIDYHLVLLPIIEDYFDRKIKTDLSIIIPDLIGIEFRGSVKNLKIKKDEIWIHFTASPEFSPSDIAQRIIREGSVRLVRINDKLIGFKLVFREDFYMKSGNKPTRARINDFISVVIGGI